MNCAPRIVVETEPMTGSRSSVSESVGRYLDTQDTGHFGRERARPSSDKDDSSNQAMVAQAAYDTAVAGLDAAKATIAVSAVSTKCQSVHQIS